MKVLVIDIETTTFLKYGGRIVEVGIVEVDIETKEKKLIFDKVIDPMVEIKELQESWPVTNGYMTAEEIINGVPFDEIKEEVQGIINNYPGGVTAFNAAFDIPFLETYGIVFPYKLPCLMLRSMSIVGILSDDPRSKYKWPSAEEAYAFFFPESNFIEKHRGGDDAMHEADILLKLVEHKRRGK